MIYNNRLYGLYNNLFADYIFTVLLASNRWLNVHETVLNDLQKKTIKLLLSNRIQYVYVFYQMPENLTTVNVGV